MWKSYFGMADTCYMHTHLNVLEIVTYLELTHSHYGNVSRAQANGGGGDAGGSGCFQRT